ncbi:MAG TPA: trans-aconitate 2-methyltransferase [Polyangiaceae bacterium]|nr:trans-aconitate 2-methyltransferase [Polyangiaceae bacterium]
MASWDQAQYLKFGDQRTRAAEELLSRVPVATAKRVVDLGCGPGNSTALLRARWPQARLTGVDSSEDMLARARRDLPDVEWVRADVRDYRADEPVDVLFANAVFQWVPDHEHVLPALLEQLVPGGALALQMPVNFDEPSHRAMRELEGPWSDRLRAIDVRSALPGPEFYYDLLATRAQGVDIWQTTYQHVMSDAQAIVEWVKGTGLRPYLDELTEAERPQYLRAYTDAMDRAYPNRADSRKLFPFPRLFVVAVR